MVIGYNEWGIILSKVNKEIGTADSADSIVAKIHELLPTSYSEELKQNGLNYKFEVGQDELTLLHLTGRFNCEKVAVALKKLEVELDVTSKTNRWTSLHFAAQYSNQAVTDVLINAGAKLDAQDKKGNTPSHCAAAEGNKKILDTLKIAGADLTLENNDGNTPEDLANARERDGIMGYDDWENILTTANKETDKSKIIEKIKGLASRSKGWEAANFDLNYKFTVGYDELTLLHLAGRFNCKEVISALREAKLDLNATSKLAQWTSLHFTAQYGHQDGADALINAGAKLNVQDKKGNTPLDCAIKEGQQGVADALNTALSKTSEKECTSTQLDGVKEEQALSNVPRK